MSIRIKVTIAFIVFCGLLAAILQHSFDTFLDAQREDRRARSLTEQHNLVLQVAERSRRLLEGHEREDRVRERLRLLEQRAAAVGHAVDVAGDAPALAPLRPLVNDYAGATRSLLESARLRARARDEVAYRLAAWSREAGPTPGAVPEESQRWAQSFTRLAAVPDVELRKQLAGELDASLQRVRKGLGADDAGALAARRLEELAEAIADWVRRSEALDRSAGFQQERLELLVRRIETHVDSSDALASIGVAEFRSVQVRLSLAVLVVVVGLVLIIWTQVIAPVRRTARLLRSIAEGEADLTQRLEVRQRDEVGDFAHWFNVFVERIQQMVQSLGVMTRELGAASSDLAGISVELSDASRLSAERARHLASTAEAVSGDVQRAADGVGELGSQYERVTGQSQSAASFSTDAVGVSQSVRETVHRLSEASVEVGELIALISSIASQTNLLAINAAIEAARAGPAGQGFAVVAEEVRRLANDTSHGADSVSQQLGSIHVDSETAEDAVGQVAAVMEKVHELQSEIAAIVGGQAGLTRSLLASMESAASGSQDIHAASETVASATEGTLNLARDTERSSKLLRQLSEDLGGVVAQFRC